jgi:3-phenylpropionate/cinnamic acid dioxygenase small subunit
MEVRRLDMTDTHVTPLEKIADRLQELEDQGAVADVLYRYGHSIDYGLEQEWLDCFTDDAEFRVIPSRREVFDEQVRVGLQPVQRKGREQLAKFIGAHTRPPERFHKHLVMEPRIHINGDEAEAHSYFVRIDANPSDTGTLIRSFGRYRDRLVRCSDSKWRIRERVAEPDAFIGVQADGRLRGPG